MTTENKVFNFDGDEIKRHIQYNMELLYKMEDSFNFVFNKLNHIGNNLDVSNLEKIDLYNGDWKEGKSYDWLSVTCNDVNLIIRKYGSHFTIYFKLMIIRELSGGEKYDSSKYGSFIFNTDKNKIDDNKCDFYYDKPCHDLNNVFFDMVKHISKNKGHMLWNPVSFKRPDHCEVEMIFIGETIYSIDKLIFCAEELSRTHLEIFAENDTLDKLKEITDSVGEKFNYEYHIKDVCTEFPKEYTEPYYHGVGLNLVKEDGKERFYDVYSLTRYYFDEIFNI